MSVASQYCICNSLFIMSCFKGRMREYRSLSIDRFDGDNLKSTAFFLSHIHSDHTVGLKENVFYERLQSSNDIFLYCSQVTKLLLLSKSKYSHLEPYVRVLPVDTPTNVSIPQPDSCKCDTIQVTLLNAAHCPGSVMFLFEGSEGTCLYTGDFRWERDHMSNIAALHEEDKSVKHIDSLYIDTTFCHESSIYIPSREDSAAAVYYLVKEWIAQGPSHVVHFTPRSQYGHEHLLKDVFMKTGHKIHVAKEKWEIYCQIPGLEDVFTCDATSTPVHACKGKWSSDSLPCGNSSNEKKVMVILPSTMYFTMRLNLDLSHIVERKGFIHRVCYSFHSSYVEVKDLVTYLQPTFVRPNVKPMPDDTILKVQGRLNEFLKLKNSKKICDSEKIRPLGKLRRSKLTKKRTHSENSPDSLDLCFGTPEKFPPPYKKSRMTEQAETDDEEHSSYAGSIKDDSEMSDICELKDEDSENKEDRPESLSLPGPSLLAALDDLDTQVSQGSDLEPLTCRVCITDDEEQTSAVVVPTSKLEEKEYENSEEDIYYNAKGDNQEKSEKNHTAEEVPKEGCDTLSTPGQSLLSEVNHMESKATENKSVKKAESRSNSFEDNFKDFLKRGDQNEMKKKNASLEAEKKIGNWVLHSQNYIKQKDQSQDLSERKEGQNQGRESTTDEHMQVVSTQSSNVKGEIETQKLQECGDSTENLKEKHESVTEYLKKDEEIKLENVKGNVYSIENLNEKQEIKIENVANNGSSADDLNEKQEIKTENVANNGSSADDLNEKQEIKTENVANNGSSADDFNEKQEIKNKNFADNNILIKDCETVMIDSSGSTVYTCDLVPNEIVDVDPNSSAKTGRNMFAELDKSLEDLFGTDNDSDDSENSYDKILTGSGDDENEKSRTEGRCNNRAVMGDSVKENRCVVNGLKLNSDNDRDDTDCVVVSDNSDIEDKRSLLIGSDSSDVEEERSLLSGKKSFSRSNSFQSQQNIKYSHGYSENGVTHESIDATNKQRLSGSSKHSAIVLDDEMSDSDETIPSSQESNSSLETMSPNHTPVKYHKKPNQHKDGYWVSRKSPDRKPSVLGQRSYDTVSSYVCTNNGYTFFPKNSSDKKLWKKHVSILPNLSPSKTKSSEKTVFEPGDMYITSNDNDSTESQDSDSSIETMSPYHTPVKYNKQNPHEDGYWNSRKSPDRKPSVRGQRSYDTVSSYVCTNKETTSHKSNGYITSSRKSSEKKLPKKNGSILPYLSPSKTKSSEKTVFQSGDMYITSNEKETTDEMTESSMIDLTASDDGTDNETDEATQNYFVID